MSSNTIFEIYNILKIICNYSVQFLQEEAFGNLELNIDWGFLFGLTSLMSVLWVGAVKILTDPKKEILIKEIKFDFFLVKPTELVDEIKILRKGNEIERTGRIEFYVTNSGLQTLNKSDFHINPSISIEGFTNLFHISISTSNEFTSLECSIVNQANLELQINDFEPKDFIRIILYFEDADDNFNPKLVFRLKESKKVSRVLREDRIKRSNGLSKDYEMLFMVFFFASTLTFILSQFIVKHGFGIDINNQESITIGWKIVFFMPTLIVSMITSVNIYSIIKHFHFGHKKVSNWYRKDHSNFAD